MTNATNAVNSTRLVSRFLVFMFVSFPRRYLRSMVTFSIFPVNLNGGV
jgi:hypothetical protein